MKLAFSLYEELLGLGQQPDHRMFNALINVCTSANDFEAAERIFQEMRDKVWFALLNAMHLQVA